MTADSIDSEKVNDAIINFFKDWAEVNLQTMSNDAISQDKVAITSEETILLPYNCTGYLSLEEQQRLTSSSHNERR